MKFSPASRSFFNLLAQFTHQKNIPHGKKVHAQILITGLFSDSYISSSLVNFYAKCQLLPQATLVFNAIDYKDVVTWNCIISGYSQQGGLNSSSFVIELFKNMMKEFTLPNAHTFSGIFTATSNLCDPLSGKQAHCVAIKTNNCSNIFVGSSLLNMYCKSGLVHDARKVFDRMPERNSVSWATMISGYSIQRLVEDSLGLFKSMICEEHEGLNEFVFTSTLSSFALPEFLNIGKQIHCLGLKKGLLSFVSMGNAIVTMYAKCGSLDSALQTFESSDNKNSITWSAMITGFAQSGESEKALKLFSSMHFFGMTPGRFTLVGVLNACSDNTDLEKGKQTHAYLVKLGFESQIYIMTALVDMYAKCGQTIDAKMGFDYVKEADIVMWTSMIGGYVQNGESEAAINLYCKMQAGKILPNELTIVSILRACASLAALEQGKQIHTHTIKFGFGLEIPVGSAISSMYTKCGNLEDGTQVFLRIPDKDVVSWNSIISGLSHNGQGYEALEFFENMLKEGTKPDTVTFITILSACSHIGLVEKGWGYFRMMSDKFGLIPAVDHYACMVDMLSRAGKLDEAKEFIESANLEYGVCLWRILLSACRNHHKYELGAYAGEKLMELGSQESSAYVMLSSIYTALGEKEDVERVRRMMSNRGISKEPGCSWIELQNHVHVFVVCDELHPQIQEIRQELGLLSKLMKDEGYQPSVDSILADLEG